MRVLMVWRETLAAAREDGRREFGDRYVLLRNEDLRADPAGALASVYGALGREVPGEVAAWAAAHVREVEEPYAAADPRWREALATLGMDAALDGKLEA
jgi:hypothetical protein